MKQRYYAFFLSLITCSYLILPMCGLSCENHQCMPSSPGECTQNSREDEERNDDLPYSFYYPYTYKYYYPELDPEDE